MLTDGGTDGGTDDGQKVITIAHLITIAHPEHSSGELKEKKMTEGLSKHTAQYAGYLITMKESSK